MTEQAPEYFSDSYAQARQKFRDAIQKAIHSGHKIEHQILKHPICTDKDGEPLTTDIAWLGPKDARAVLLVSSGLHGVEGFAGSAIQLKMLTEHKKLPKDTAIVFAHAVNPYGFQNCRRVNEDNVDMNRNFIDWSKTPPSAHHLSTKIQSILVPEKWNWPIALLKIMLLRVRHSMNELQQALTKGQYNKPDGLFYGGLKAAWTNAVMRDVIKSCTTKAAYLAHVDVHTGLGPSGQAELIITQPENSAMTRRAREWWGNAVKSVIDGDSISADVSGCVEHAHSQTDQSKCETTVIGLEFGTVPPFDVMKALAFDNWVYNKDKSGKNIEKARQQMRAAFAPNDKEWERQILAGGQKVMDDALIGLQSSLQAAP